MISTVLYKGKLRTEATHLNSGDVIITDAPKDNQGNGEAFSPTDLASTALASCMMTIMGISANNHEILFENCKAEVTKIMGSNPRRIAEIKVELFIPNQNYSSKQKKILEKAALNCPVALSLSQETKQTVIFHWE